MDSTLVAHVADSLERIGEPHDAPPALLAGYDTNADFACGLLDVTESLVTSARMYAHGDMTDRDFDEQVRIAIAVCPYESGD